MSILNILATWHIKPFAITEGQLVVLTFSEWMKVNNQQLVKNNLPDRQCDYMKTQLTFYCYNIFYYYNTVPHYEHEFKLSIKRLDTDLKKPKNILIT